ncbi:MAG: sodium:solute symporter family protein [Desulfotalea sp.]
MLTKILILSSYFLCVLVLGLLVKRNKNDNHYFIANRGLHPAILVGTLCATNFSAFTIFGASGAGYRDGLAYFPIMAFGTGFMALSFWLIGSKIWELGQKHNLITPAELISVIYKSKTLSTLFAFIMIIFTLPYLALQPYAAGKVLQQMFNIPHNVGAILITIIVVIYTARGGLKAVALTDVLQGFLMLGLMLVALAIVTTHHGGFTVAITKLTEQYPELLSRPGLSGFYTPQIWFSFMVLWFLCDPMFPQIFQRFYAAKSSRDIKITAALYPIICTIIFFLPITIGALGRLSFPDLSTNESDNIMAMLMNHLAGPILGTLVLTAGIAALMSTMDSQLLTLSSIFKRDICPLLGHKSPDISGKIFTILLAISGLTIALFTNTTILNLGLTSFTGLAVLFPTVFFGLYLKNPKAKSALFSIIVGEFFVIIYHLKLLPSFGFLPVIPISSITVFTYITTQAVQTKIAVKHFIKWGSFIIFGIIFIAALDFWNWNKIGSTFLSLPLWIWYFSLLSLIQSCFSFYLLKVEDR